MRINKKTMDYQTRQTVRAIKSLESTSIKSFKQNPNRDFTGFNDKITNKLHDIGYDFTAYVWGFYGTGGVYQEFFEQNPITIDEVIRTEKQLVKKLGFNFTGDSIDRERARDLMMISRGITTEEECLFTLEQ